MTALQAQKKKNLFVKGCCSSMYVICFMRQDGVFVPSHVVSKVRSKYTSPLQRLGPGRWPLNEPRQAHMRVAVGSDVGEWECGAQT